MSDETLTTPAPPPEIEEDILADLGRLQLVDVSSGVQSESRESAEEFIHRQTNVQEGQRLGRVRAFARRIWQGNIARDYYLRTEEMRARRDIVDTQQMYIRAGGSPEEHIRAMSAVLGRFTSDYEETLTEAEAQSQDELSASEPGQRLIQDVQQLVHDYANNPNMSYDALVEARTRIVSQYGTEAHRQDRNRGLMYADNILEIAANARAAVEHSLGLDRIDQAISQARVGEARMGARTEFRRDSFDKALDYLHRTRAGALVNESTLGMALAVALTIKNVTFQKAAVAAGATIGLGVGAAGIAAWRERTRVKDERQIHLRQRAEGAPIPEGAQHREQMEQTRFQTISAENLTDQLRSVIDGVDPSDQASLRRALTAVSTAEIYTNQSDTRDIDLIEYSSKTSVEEQRFNMLVMLAEAKVALQRHLDASPDGLGGIKNVDQLVDGVRNDLEGLIQGDIDEKDKAYIKIRNRRMLKMGAIAFVSGTTLGLAYQEVHGLLDSDLAGIGQDSHGNRQTLIEGLYHSITGGGSGHHLQPGPVHEQGWNDATFIHHPVDLPDGYKLVHARPGEKFGWDIVDSKGHNALDHMDWDKWKEMVNTDHSNHHVHHITEGHTGIGFDEQGNLDHDSRAALTSLHWNLDQHHIQYNDHHLKHFHHRVSPHHYVAGHPKEFVPFHRELWYDNNTPGNYDLNELREYWGGNGTGINANGDYVLNVAHMLPGWSFHDSQAANAPNLIHNGKMYIALSMSKDTQHFAHFFQVNHNGEAIIPKGSPDAQAMFETTNGHARFIGGYAEAVQVTGHTPNGGVSGKMLATVVGENQPRTVTETVTRSVAFKHHHFVTALHPPAGGPEGLPTELPPVIPIYSRRGLESITYPEVEVAPSYYGYDDYEDEYYDSAGGERLDRPSAPFARELESDPDTDVDANVVAKRYLEASSSKQKAIVQKLGKNLEKQPKAKSPKAVIMIPAAAHQEGKNIYRTLQQYTLQEGVDKDDFEIVVFANNPLGTKRDKTVSEVRRFQNDFPDIFVRLIEKRLDPKEAKMGWIRKTVTDTVITDLAKRGVDLNEVILVSNDADSLWIDKRYLSTLIRKSEQQKDYDGFLGFVEWDYDAYKAYPQELVATRFMQMID
ncbi:MAG TPA: hypothetical protein VLF88_01235, partial [Candidatus Babeliales bacterium]|nr:hypothetical protein [Candidatus Babeliales bacterium]